MDASVETRREVKFMGIVVRSAEEQLQEMIDAARTELSARAAEFPKSVNAAVQLCVTRPDEPERDPQEVITYVGFEVAELPTPPPGMSSILIPAGRYARFELDAADQLRDDSYAPIFQWLKEQGIAPSADRPWVEICDVESEDGRTTVLIPLQERW